MKTQIIKLDQDHLDQEKINSAAEILRAGGLVAFPTETVYGLGANALDTIAAKKIYEAKGRPSDNPLIVHIANKEDVYLYATDISDKAELLMERFWPGPLTLVLKKQPCIPSAITGGLDTVAIRLPESIIARAIIKASELPIAAPSANRSGKPSPTRARHVVEDLEGRVDMIVDGGKATIGLESTVLDVTTDTPQILRPGFITKEMLQEIVGTVTVDQSLLQLDQNLIPKSPGMKYKHYAPKGQLLVVQGEDEKAIEHINSQLKQLESQGKRVGIIATNEDANKYSGEHVVLIGSKNNSHEIASNLFKVLRLMDEKQIDVIFSRAFSSEDIGVATMNRLMKAAGNQVVIAK